MAVGLLAVVTGRVLITKPSEFRASSVEPYSFDWHTLGNQIGMVLGDTLRVMQLFGKGLWVARAVTPWRVF